MVKIISDSTCDLSKDLIEKYNISIIPLHILLGENEYEDGVDITPDEIYKWADKNKTTPKTSAPSVDTAERVMRQALEEADELVCFSISETMSSSGNVMKLVAEDMGVSEKVFVVNSKNLSTGIGHLVIEAAVMAINGSSASEIVERIEDIIPKVRASFVVDTLTYLHRGGRCSGLAAMAGGVLKLHPRIDVVDGVMGAGRKYRGKLEKVIINYAEDLEPDLKKAKKDRVFITHSGCDKEIVDSVRDFLTGLDVFDEILETRAGGVISSHCGPGTLGVLFISGE
ncbi:MAG: DegV family protein [Lachnospiraceae bacterium]|jgi:DegV family protein with EDD domain